MREFCTQSAIFFFYLHSNSSNDTKFGRFERLFCRSNHRAISANLIAFFKSDYYDSSLKTAFFKGQEVLFCNIKDGGNSKEKF